MTASKPTLRWRFRLRSPRNCSPCVASCRTNKNRFMCMAFYNIRAMLLNQTSLWGHLSFTHNLLGPNLSNLWEGVWLQINNSYPNQQNYHEISLQLWFWKEQSWGKNVTICLFVTAQDRADVIFTKLSLARKKEKSGSLMGFEPRSLIWNLNLLLLVLATRSSYCS